MVVALFLMVLSLACHSHIASARPRKAVRSYKETSQRTFKQSPAVLRSSHCRSRNLFVERWESESPWRTHMSGEAMERFEASGAGNVIEESVLHRLKPVAG